MPMLERLAEGKGRRFAANVPRSVNGSAEHPRSVSLLGLELATATMQHRLGVAVRLLGAFQD